MKKIISHETHKRPLILDGFELNCTELLVEHCDISGDFTEEGAIMYRNFEKVNIRRNKIHDVLKASGIVGRSTGQNKNVTISDNDIWNIALNGIISKRNNFNVHVTKNRITNTGIAGEAYHGVYMLSMDGVVDWNWINLTSGNCVSLRSGGSVLFNLLWNAAKASVRYTSDGLRGPSDKVDIGFNTCVNPSTEHPAISLYYLFGGELVNEYHIHDNNISSPGDAFAAQGMQFAGKRILVYDNWGSGVLQHTHVSAEWGNALIAPVSL